MAKLIIRRKFSIKCFCKIPFSIFIDGKQITSIYSSQIMECDINEGKHLITIKSPTKYIEQTIIIKKDTESVEIVLGSLRVFIYMIPQIREINFKNKN